jgi:hypothetical protein
MKPGDKCTDQRNGIGDGSSVDESRRSFRTKTHGNRQRASSRMTASNDRTKRARRGAPTSQGEASVQSYARRRPAMWDLQQTHTFVQC